MRTKKLLVCVGYNSPEQEDGWLERSPQAGCVARAGSIKVCGVRPRRPEHCLVCNASLSATLAPSCLADGCRGRPIRVKSKMVKDEERWPSYASQRPQNVDAMLAQIDRNERAKAQTVPSRGRNVRVAAAGVGALVLTVVVAYFQLSTSAPAVSEHDVVTGILSDGTIVQVEMPQAAIRGPQKASGDTSRPQPPSMINLASPSGPKPYSRRKPNNRTGKRASCCPRNRNRRSKSKERRTHLWSMAGRSSTEKRFTCRVSR